MIKSKGNIKLVLASAVVIILSLLVPYIFVTDLATKSINDIHVIMEFWTGIIVIAFSIVILVNFFATRDIFKLIISLEVSLQVADRIMKAIIGFQGTVVNLNKCINCNLNYKLVLSERLMKNILVNHTPILKSETHLRIN